MSDAPAAAGPVVRKRDGSIEAFQPPKVRRALRLALLDAGDVDPPATAEGLCDALVRHLAEQDRDRSISADEVAELIESILSQTGFATAGLVFREHRRRRNRMRRALLVTRYHGRLDRYVNSRWNKGTIVSALSVRHGLEIQTARQIGGLVESAILRSGLRVVTTGLVSETVASELLAWGLCDAALTVSRRRGRRTHRRSQPDRAERTD